MPINTDRLAADLDADTDALLEAVGEIPMGGLNGAILFGSLTRAVEKVRNSTPGLLRRWQKRAREAEGENELILGVNSRLTDEYNSTKAENERLRADVAEKALNALATRPPPPGRTRRRNLRGTRQKMGE